MFERERERGVSEWEGRKKKSGKTKRKDQEAVMTTRKRGNNEDGEREKN